MNINKICAAVSALCFAGTAVTLSMNNLNNDKAFALENPLGDVDGNGVIDGVDASTVLSYYAYISANHDGTTLEQFIDKQNDTPANKLKSGGDTFTVAVWNADEYPRLISTWLNVTEDAVADSYYSQTMTNDPVDDHVLNTLKTPSGASLRIINFGVGGADASEHYDSLFLQGEDMDVY